MLDDASTQTPFGYMGELGEERLHCGTGFGDRYRVPKVTSAAAFCVSKVNLFSILLRNNSISVCYSILHYHIIAFYYNARKNETFVFDKCIYF